MVEVDCEAVVSDVCLRTGREMEWKPLLGRNGIILKLYPWSHLPAPWARMHVEATPEKRRGDGYSIHLDFYAIDRLKDHDAAARSVVVGRLRELIPEASHVIGQPFSVAPRPNKAHILVEQERCVLLDTWGRDPKIAELMAHYITAFGRTVAELASA